MAAARDRFRQIFGWAPDPDECGCCGDGGDDFDADELGLDPEED